MPALPPEKLRGRRVTLPRRAAWRLLRSTGGVRHGSGMLPASPGPGPEAMTRRLQEAGGRRKEAEGDTDGVTTAAAPEGKLTVAPRPPALSNSGAQEPSNRPAAAAARDLPNAPSSLPIANRAGCKLTQCRPQIRDGPGARDITSANTEREGSRTCNLAGFFFKGLTSTYLTSPRKEN